MMNTLTSYVLAPSGSSVAAGAADGAVFESGVGAGAARVRHAGLDEPVEHLSFSSDGALLMGCGGRGRAAVWAAGREQPVHVLEHGAGVLRGAVLADGSYVTVDRRWVTRLWSVDASGALQAEELPLRGPIRACAARPGRGDVVLVDGLDVVLWDVARRAEARRYQTLTPSAMASVEGELALSPDGEHLLIHWDEGAVIETRTVELVLEFSFVPGIACAAVSDSGRLYALGSTQGLVWIGDDSGAEPTSYPVSRGAIRAVSVAGGRVAFLDEHGQAGILDARTGQPVG